MKKTKKWLAGSFMLLTLAASVGQAAVSPDEAARLKGDLNPFGGEKAANSAGTIPAWNGGLSTPPKGYTTPGQHHPDPFAGDPVQIVIDAKNLAQHRKHVSDGVAALIAAYPTTFTLPVYQSRRTHTTPDWVMKNTYKNATTAELVANGSGISGAYGGIPFPILSGSNEEKAQQAMWNHVTRWRGIALTRQSGEVAVQRNGEYSLVMSQQEVFWNFYDPKGSEKTLENVLFYYLSFTTAPARLAGGAVLVHETLDQIKEARQAWGYNAGQRRVRRAPNLAYDSPIAAAENLRTADDTDLFNGALDRYNWKYVGKKELYIPYNSYQVSQKKLPYAQVLGVSHINPEVTRWELHRVHVIEANLKHTERHIYSKRVFYIDEDSWNIALVDQFDARGELWRVSMGFLKNFYELPGVWTAIDVFYDLQARRYHVQGLDSQEPMTRVFTDKTQDKRYFSPAELRRRGVR